MAGISGGVAKRGKNLLVVGQGAAATAVAAAISRLGGVGYVRQAAVMDATLLGQCDAVVEMVGGVTPAFDVAMAALGRGIACISANPLLVAAHGRVLQDAAAGQCTYFGFQSAGFGVPMAEALAALPVTRMTMGLHGVANMVLARLGYRAETVEQASAYVRLQNPDMSDMGGKLTQARAVALRALWHPVWGRVSGYARTGLELVEPSDVQRLREFGLNLVYGAEISAEGIYTGPLAVGHDSPLLAAQMQDVLVMQTVHGEMVLSQPAEESVRMVAGVTADVRQWLRSIRPALALVEPARAVREDTTRCFVRLPYARREAIVALKPEILKERVVGDGLWQAVLSVPQGVEIQPGEMGGVVYPVSGAWEPAAAAGLRLVS